jgi:hypothetical protein
MQYEDYSSNNTPKLLVEGSNNSNFYDILIAKNE